MQYVSFNAKVHWEMTETHEGRQILPGGPDNASEQWKNIFTPASRVIASKKSHSWVL